MSTTSHHTVYRT